MASCRIGQGFDIHRLVPDKPLMIGGIRVESPVGSEAHSDGDALLHALMDALLGAAALGDIGEHFPPSDQQFKGADSSRLLSHVLTLLGGYRILNVDATVFLEAPKLSPYKPAICAKLAKLTGLQPDQVSLKAKTAEGLGAIGTRQAIGASVVVLLEKA